MATSTATAYRETPGSASGNISPFRLKHLVRYSGIPLPQRHLILAALEISQDAGVVIWSSVKSLSVETKMCERTIYHRRRRMLELELWEPIRKTYTWDDCPKCGGKRESNKCADCGYRCDHAGHNPSACSQFRRPPTFRLNVEKIAAWPRPKGVRAGSYKEYKGSPEYPGRKRAESGHRSTSHSSPSNEGDKRIAPAAKPALVEPSAEKSGRDIRSTPAHRSISVGSRAAERVRKLQLELAGKVTELMRGTDSLLETHTGIKVRLQPGDSRYRAPMPQERALIAACLSLGLSDAEGEELLKHWKPESAQGP